jgi:hypothetical protein
MDDQSHRRCCRQIGTVSCLLIVIALALSLASAEVGAERVFDLAIAHGELSGGPETIRVHQGDTVVLHWRSDRPAVAHLHGYDIETRIMPGTVAETRFQARAAGRFPVHLHAGSGSSESVLVYLEVYPN